MEEPRPASAYQHDRNYFTALTQFGNNWQAASYTLFNSKHGVRMSYTLAGAATATGQSKKAILRAIRDGKIAGTKDELGNWSIDAAALHVVFPLVAEPQGDTEDAVPPYTASEVEALSEQIEALLRQAGARLRQQLDEVRRDRDTTAHDQGLALADQHEQLA
jgi:hypothetical protein